MEAAYAAVIPESLPELQTGVFIRRCERRDVGKRRKKTMIVSYDCFHSCLLEHDFGEPDVVRRGILPPGKDSLMIRIPVKQFVCKLFLCILHIHEIIVADCR